MWLDRISTALTLAVVALTWAMPPTAWADEADARGRFHFQAGASYYEAGDYEDALREFERAYDVSERPELFYNISLCHQQLGHLAEAADYLEKYLEQVEDLPNRVNLERRLENLRSRMETQDPDDPDTAAPPPEAPDETPAPETQPEGTFEGDTRVVGVERPEEAEGGVPLAAIIGWSVGGALLTAGTITGGMSLGERSNVRDLDCAATNTCSSDDVARLRRLGLMTDVFLAAGVTAAAVGTVLFFVMRDKGNREPEGPSSAVRVSPWVDPMGGGGATIGGRF